MASKKSKKVSKGKPKERKKYEVEVIKEVLIIPKRADYPNVEDFFNAVYYMNQEKIDQALAVKYKNVKTGKEEVLYPEDRLGSFKNSLYGYMKEGLPPVASLRKLQNSTMFLPIQEIMKRNVMQYLKKHKKYNQFRALNRNAEGKFMPFDRENLKWDPEEHLYYYTTNEYEISVYENGNLVKKKTSKMIAIEIDNSPEDVKVYEVD